MSVYAKIRVLAKEFHMNVPLRLVEDFEYEGRNATQTLMCKWPAKPVTYRA